MDSFKSMLFKLLIISMMLLRVKSNVETLVLLDNLAIRETHSIFFKSLQGLNHYLY